MTIRFRVLESFDGEPAQNDESLSVVPYAEYEKQQTQIEALTLELEATRELAFQDGYKSASSEARGLVEHYYQRLADNMVSRVHRLEEKLEESAQQIAQHYAQMVYTIATHLFPRYVMAHCVDEFVSKISEILIHNDDRRVAISANQPMITRLQAMEKLPHHKIEWRMNNTIHDGEIEAVWERGGHHVSAAKILKSVDEILTSCLNIDVKTLEAPVWEQPLVGQVVPALAD
jgi:hypothetical protein